MRLSCEMAYFCALKICDVRTIEYGAHGDRCAEHHDAFHCHGVCSDVCMALREEQGVVDCDCCHIWVSHPCCPCLVAQPLPRRPFPSFLMNRFSCGTYVSLLPAPAMEMGAIGDVGRRAGMFMSSAALGAIAGPPISGAINSATGGFEYVGWYAGECFSGSWFSVLWCQWCCWCCPFL